MSRREGGGNHRGGGRGGGHSNQRPDSSRGDNRRGGFNQGGGGGGRGGFSAANLACFKCQQLGHLSRDCPGNASSSRGGAGGGGAGGRGRGRGNLDINIDGGLKSDVGKILKEFQENPELMEYAFPPDLNNTERRFIHTFCKNFGLTSKSTGKGAERYCVIYKGREKKEEKAAKKHPLTPLSFNSMDSTRLIDAVLQAFPLPAEFNITESIGASIIANQDEVDLSALAAQFVHPRSRAEMDRLSANLKQMYDARQGKRAAAPASELQTFRRKLPIHNQREDILKMIDSNQVLVLSSSTGSGKSTQVPQYILEHLDAMNRGGEADIIVTQPRRISAMSLAQRVSQEREVENDNLGDTVGYQIRLESVKSSKTRLLYCTIGVLLRRLASDRLLSGVSYLIIDEVHERDRLCDFLLIILKDILPLRPDLKVILMSATLNADMFSQYFGGCPHIHIEGFTYPVHTFFLEDVIELTGYTPPSLSRADATKRKQQQDQMKEKKLMAVLNQALNSVLTLEAKVEQKHNGGLVKDAKSLIENEGEDDDAALAALAQIAEQSHLGFPSSGSSSSAAGADIPIGLLAGLDASNKVTGWSDNYVYKPEVENPWEAETAASSNEANLLSSLDSIIAGEAPGATASQALSSPPPMTASTSPHPSAVSAAALSSSITKINKNNLASSLSTVGSTLQNPLSGLNYSQDTLEAIRKIEEEGMDYIDYDLILRVIVYICQKFDESHMSGNMGAHRSNNSKRKGKSAAGGDEDEDDDPINIYNGSILVFVPGWEDICKLLDLVAEHPILQHSKKFLCLPLHGSISSQQQRLIFQRPGVGQRKIIFSTNIAETSITIDDVVFVIDSGKMKEKTYDALTKMCALSSTWVSQANAKQRSGRAGRCRRGVCFRLYTQAKFNSMEVFQTPELLRTPLEELCLQVKLLKLGKVETFLSKALQPPARHSVLDALDLLIRLGAMDKSENLTILGEYLASMPLDPRLAKMILYGAIFKCLDPVLTIAAALSYRDPFVLPVMWERERAAIARAKLANGSQSDMICLLNAFHGYAYQLQTNGMRGVNDYCRQNFLSVTTLQMIDKLKVQYMDTLKETGWLDSLIDSPASASSGGKNKRHHEHSIHSRAALKNLLGTDPRLNQHQHNLSVLTAVVALGMYPLCARVQVQRADKKRRALLCTRNALQNVCLHPACVSNKDFRRQASKNDAWTATGAINLSEADQSPFIVQYCVFFESMRSSEVFLRNVHWVQPILLALFGTGNREKPVEILSPQKPKKKSAGAKKKDDGFPQGADYERTEGDYDPIDDDEDDDEEDEESEDDFDDDNTFHVDEWIRFATRPDDAARFHALRRYLSFVLESFIRRAGSHPALPGWRTTEDQQAFSNQVVEFFVKLLGMELAPTQTKKQQQFRNQASEHVRQQFSEQQDQPHHHQQQQHHSQQQRPVSARQILARPTPPQAMASSSSSVAAPPVIKPGLSVQELEQKMRQLNFPGQQPQPQHSQQQFESQQPQHHHYHQQHPHTDQSAHHGGRGGSGGQRGGMRGGRGGGGRGGNRGGRGGHPQH